MPSRPHPQAPDLFAAAAATKAAPLETGTPAINPLGDASPPRHLLPKDLSGALTRLGDSEIDALLGAVLAEAKRRHRLPSNLMERARDAGRLPRDEVQSKAAPRSAAHLRRTVTQDDVASLTQSQINAVRAAFKAGVKPFTIARQFGLSKSEVRTALASDMPERRR